MSQCTICYQPDTRLRDISLALYECSRCSHVFSAHSQPQEEYDNAYFLEKHKHWFENPHYNLFRSILKQLRNNLGQKLISLLDVGCGNGDFLKYVKKTDTNFNLAGLDIAEQTMPNIELIQADFNHFTTEKRYDVVSNLQVMEHVENPHENIQKMHEFLKPGGYLVISTINSGGLVYKTARVLNRLGYRTAFERLYSPHHLQHYTNQSLKKLIEKNGFQVKIQENRNYPLTAVDVPKSSKPIEILYKCLVAALFAISSPLGIGIHQTLYCKKT